MSQNYMYLGLFLGCVLFLAIPTSSGSCTTNSNLRSETTPFPSSTVSTTAHQASPSPTPLSSSKSFPSASPASPTPTAWSSAQSFLSASPASPIPTALSPTGGPSTAQEKDTGGKTTEAPSRSEKKLLIGLVVAYFTVLVLIAVTFHWISRREKMKAAKGTEFEMDASALCGSAATRLGNISEPEVGITHQAFAEDSENPANETVPESHEVPVQFSEDTKL
ncbi:unnamed protein product [Pocillopora meandrina]|uniref:Transmembrane protein n=1 Tax=Pocillopora meandrina TaxID=46732 RepID=A0AAU9WVT6_9CNID|nr:unnamed protein product [Pocillopora meandrina]